MAPWRPGENSRRPSLRAGDRGPARPLARSSPSRGRCGRRDRLKAGRWRPSAASPRCHGGTGSPPLPERSMPRRASPPRRRGQTMAAAVRHRHGRDRRRLEEAPAGCGRFLASARTSRAEASRSTRAAETEGSAVLNLIWPRRSRSNGPKRDHCSGPDPRTLRRLSAQVSLSAQLTSVPAERCMF